MPDPSLVTVIFCDKLDVTPGWIKLALDEFYSKDDVFQREFLEAVLITHTGSDSLKVTSDAREYLRFQGAEIVTTRRLNSDSEMPTPGPYWFSNGHLHQAWKLYDDTHGAFLKTFVLGPTGYVLFMCLEMSLIF